MARSSGGGSRGGGSRGGGSRGGSRGGSYSRGRNGTRISKTPFIGSRKFRYYRDGVAHYVYSDKYLPAMSDPKPRWFFIIFYIPFLFAVFSMFSTVIVTPEKPMSTYSVNDVAVIDTADVFTEYEEQVLLEKLKEFGNSTGVTTQIITVDYEEWIDNGSLESYSYYRYYAQFNNENSWLLTYSELDNGKGEWYWEGTQGDNTIDTMDVFLEDFNTTLHSKLVVDQIADPSAAFLQAFDKSIYLFENQKTHFNFSMLIPALFTLGFISVHAYVMIFAGTRKKYSYKELQEVIEQPSIQNMNGMSYNMPNSYPYNTQTPYSNSPPEEKTFECKYCGYKYKEPKDNRCPNCNALMQ